MADPHARDAARLVALALDTRARPGGNAEYADLVARVRADSAFDTTFRDVAEGLGLRVLDVGEMGVVLGTEADSPFAFTTRAWRENLSGDERILVGLIQVGLAACVFPRPEELEGMDVKHISVQELDAFIREVCTRLKVAARDDVEPPEGDADLEHAWRVYLRWPSVGEGPSGHRARKTTQALIRSTLDRLAETGMLRPSGEDAYHVLHRFRVQVREIAGHAALARLRAAMSG